jgi:hypothetical protein
MAFHVPLPLPASPSSDEAKPCSTIWPAFPANHRALEDEPPHEPTPSTLRPFRTHRTHQLCSDSITIEQTDLHKAKHFSPQTSVDQTPIISTNPVAQNGNLSIKLMKLAIMSTTWLNSSFFSQLDCTRQT